MSKRVQLPTSLLRGVRTAAILFILLVFAVQIPASALTPVDRRRNAYRGISFTDEPCSAGGANSVNSADNIVVAMQFFVSNGLSAVQAAGIVGNLHAESSVIPSRQEGEPPSYIATAPINGIGFGIAQWTYTSRQAPLVASAEAAGVPVNTLQVQLDYVWYELTHGYMSDLNALKTATTTRDATNIILQHYEAPKVKDEAVLNTRTSLADKDLQLYGAAGGDIGITPCAGTASGEDCTSLGRKSESYDPKKNPYVCTNQDMKCPAGTDAGIGDGYAEGKLYKIRLCKVQGITVNAFVAGKLDAMLTKALSELGKLTGGGFRTMTEQQQLWAASNHGTIWPVAPPGYSNHQMGLAIDFSGIAIYDPHNPKFIWLSNNANGFGLYNLPSESWHWSVDAH